MISQFHILHEKYRTERSNELAAVCDIKAYSISLVYYDLALSRRYARTALIGEKVSSGSIVQQLSRLFMVSAREYGISAAAVKILGFAAPTHLSCYLEEAISPTDLCLRPETEIYIMPFISASMGGGFTAALMAVPKKNCLAADFGNTLCLGKLEENRLICAAFPLRGAFDGTALESGMSGERGAIDEVQREKDGTICYSVVGDTDSIGIAPTAAAQAVRIMLGTGSLDSDGIMTDRDLFYIGEDFYISQSDVRAVQSDKARSAAALELFLRETGEPAAAFLSGEPFAGRGLETMQALGAVPNILSGAGFCRNSSEQGLIRCIESAEERRRAFEIASAAEDITERLLRDFDDLYIKNLPF